VVSLVLKIGRPSQIWSRYGDHPSGWLLDP